MSRKRKPSSGSPTPWTRFERVERAPLSPEQMAEIEAQAQSRGQSVEEVLSGMDRSTMYANSQFLVHLTEMADGLVWLSIRRVDRKPIRDWRALQRIKNEIVGRDREACELYPSEARLVDLANQYHLWVLPRGERFPFGFNERDVDYDPSVASAIGAKQRAEGA